MNEYYSLSGISFASSLWLIIFRLGSASQISFRAILVLKDFQLKFS